MDDKSFRAPVKYCLLSESKHSIYKPKKKKISQFSQFEMFMQNFLQEAQTSKKSNVLPVRENRRKTQYNLDRFLSRLLSRNNYVFLSCLSMLPKEAREITVNR